MGQIVGLKAKPKRTNLNDLSLVSTPANGEIILVSSDNSMTADGQGYFDCYIVGDGRTAATALELNWIDGKLIEEVSQLGQEVTDIEHKVIDINFGQEIVMSNNILAPEAILDKTTKYIRKTDGVTIQSTGGYGYTDFIPIDERGLIINNGMAPAGAYGAPIICYDANKNYLGKWPFISIAIDSVDGTAYVRFNLGDPSIFAEGGSLAGQDYAVYRSLKLLPYDEYKFGRKLKEGTVETANIKDNAITKEKVSEETWNEKADGEYVILSTNVLDPAKITNPGYYISNDGVTLRSGGFGTTDFIPRKGEAVVCYNNLSRYGVYQFPTLVYDANKQFLRVHNQPYYDWQEGDAYVRFNLGDPSGLETPNYQVNYIPAGTTQRLPYEPFRASVIVPDRTIVTSKLADKAVTFEKIEFRTKETGKNKLNPSAVQSQKYINRNSGAVGTWGGTSITDYIPVSKSGLYFNKYYVGGENMGAAVYNSAKQYIRSCPNPYVYVEGDAYVRYTFESVNLATAQVEEGASATPYEAYTERPVIDPTYIPTMPEGEETPDVEVFLPDRIYAVVGDTIQLFFKGMVKAVNALNYNIYVVCSKGQIFHRYWQYTPSISDVGTVTFRVTVRDNNGNTISSKSCSLVTVATPTSPATEKKVVCVGASETANGIWPAEVGRRLVGTGGTPIADGITNVRLCGTKTKDGFGYVGNSGWGWPSYATSGSPAFRFVVGTTPNLSVGSVYSNNGHNYYIVEISDNGTILCETSLSGNTPQASGVLTKVSGSGDTTVPFSSASLDSANPFWDYTNNKLTFIPFANAYCDGVIDVMYILLGINGNTPFKTDFSAWETNIKAIADTLHTEFPNAKLVLLSYCFPSMELMMPGYGANGGWADIYGMLTAFFNEQKFYQEFANDADYSGFVDYVALAPEVDSDNNFPITMKDVNTRNNTKQEPYANNTIHAGNAGYLQIADAVYRHIVGAFLQS